MHPLPADRSAVLQDSEPTTRVEYRSGDRVAAGGEHSTAAPERFVELLLAELWRHVDEMAASELHRVRPQLADLSLGEREAVEVLATRLPRAILHGFVTRLRLGIRTDDRALIEAAGFFLGADAQQPPAPVPIWRPNVSEG